MEDIIIKLNDILKYKLAFILGNTKADTDTCLELACTNYGDQHLAPQLNMQIILYAVRKFLNEAVKSKIRSISPEGGKSYIADILSQICDVDRTTVRLILGLVESYIARLKKTGSRMNARLQLEAELISHDVWQKVDPNDIALAIGSKKTVHLKLVVSLLHTFRHLYGDLEVDEDLVDQIIPLPNLESLVAFITSPIFDLIVLA